MLDANGANCARFAPKFERFRVERSGLERPRVGGESGGRFAAMARTHYEVLGVPRTASAEELRRAYLERARLLHPDRHIDAGPKGRAEAEWRMQEVTEAWRVLGDAGRRRRYDRELGGPVRAAVDDDRFTTRSDGTFPEEVELLDPTARLIRGLPWIALAVVLIGIFIFTAYAATGGTKKQQPAT